MIVRAAVLDKDTSAIVNMIVIDDSLLKTFLQEENKELIVNPMLQIGDTYDGENFWRDGKIVGEEEITGEDYE